MKERRIPALDANGLMTDEALAHVAGLEFVTSLGLGGSRELTDDGQRHLSHMPQLERLDVSEYPEASSRTAAWKSSVTSRTCGSSK